MTTPAKQYQNVSFKELMSYSENNPNRTRALDSIEVQTMAATPQETSLDKLGLKGYTAFTLNPTGVVSLFTCIQDPTTYSLSAKGARTQLIIDTTTKLQEQTDELKNGPLSRKRRKIHDLIGASYNGSVFEDKDYLELFAGLAHLRNCHFVLMKSAVQEDIEEGGKQYASSLKGEIVFSSDPSTWKYENPVWVADYRARWVAIPSERDTSDLHKLLGTWLSSVEQTGWVVQWPEVEGTKTEIMEKLSTMPIWQATDKKLSKELLAARLGRANCIQVFTKWMMNEHPVNI